MSNLNVTKDKSMTYEEWQKEAMEKGINFFDESIVAFEEFAKYAKTEPGMKIYEYMFMGDSNRDKAPDHWCFKHQLTRQSVHIPKPKGEK